MNILREVYRVGSEEVGSRQYLALNGNGILEEVCVKVVDQEVYLLYVKLKKKINKAALGGNIKFYQ